MALQGRPAGGHLSSGHGAGTGGGHCRHVVARFARVGVRGQAADGLVFRLPPQSDLARVAAALHHVLQRPRAPVGQIEVIVVIIIVVIQST